MIRILLILLLGSAFGSVAQTNELFSPFDARHWGVVLENPNTKNVVIKRDVTYLNDGKGSLHIDIYMPPGIQATEKRPAVVFLNGIGEAPGQPRVKSWGIYNTWPQLMAANGIIGISMETDGTRVQESMRGLFKFLNENSSIHNIDPTRLGVYAASANVTQSGIYLMSEDAFKGIKAAVLYYGTPPLGPYRKDLSVLFVIAEGDVGRTNYSTLWAEVLKNNAPWTIKMGTALPHAFDAFEDTDESRRVVKETISFWKNNLESVEQPSWPSSLPRQALSAQYMQNHDKAADLTKEWLQTHPQDEPAWRSFGTSLKRANRLVEAEAALKKYLEKQPNDPNTLVGLSQVLYGLNKDEEAKQIFSKAEKTMSLQRFHHTSTASYLYQNKKFGESASYYQKALALEPRAVDFYNMACSWSLGGNKDKAFEALNKAVELGYNGKSNYENDADLASLKQDARWNELLTKLK